MTTNAPSIGVFYDRWAAVYSKLAHHAPGVARLRQRTVDELALEPGETVLDLGCGPGVNFRYLRAGVGPEGTIIGIDVAPGMLERAARSDPRAEMLLGDASQPPLTGGVDAILATFVVTLFEDPEAVIDRWWDLLPPGGRLGLLNLGQMRGLTGSLGNPFLKVGLELSTPGTERFDRALIEVLDERVRTAHRTIDDRAATISYYDSVDGLFRVVVGQKSASD